jgi:hypothetical protein
MVVAVIKKSGRHCKRIEDDGQRRKVNAGNDWFGGQVWKKEEGED